MVKISKKLKTKSDIILEIAKKHNLSIAKAGLFVEAIFNEITQALLKNQKVELRGFGTFGVKKYKAYKGRNPKTQEIINIKAKKRPWFKPGQIHDLLNKK